MHPDTENEAMSEIETAFSAVVGRPPELRTSKSGKPWASFSAVVGKEAAAQWVRVAIFNEKAETLSRTLQKGDRVYCEGRLTASVWIPDSGPPRVQLDVAAWKCERLNQIGRNKPKREQAAEDGHDNRSDDHRQFDDDRPM